MKRSLKIILILVVIFIGINNVSAFSTDKNIIYSRGKSGTASVANLKTGGNAYSTSMYKMTGNGKTYVAYCMDPHKPAASEYTLDRILGSSGSVGVQAYDMGILEILKHAYTQINSSYTLQDIVTPESSPNRYEATVSGNNLYASASIAIRTFTLALYGWGGWGVENNTYMIKQASAHINLGINWSSWASAKANKIMGVTCSSQSECQKKYLNLRKSTYSWFNSNYQFTGWTYGTASYDVIYAAQELFYHALNAAMEVYDNGGVVSSSVKGEVTSTAIDGTRTENEVQEFVYVNMSLKDFSEEAYVNNFNITCSNCSGSGITIDYMEYYNASNEWVSLTPDVDISKVLTPDEKGLRTGDVKLRVHATKQVLDEEECSNANFTITYDYFDPSIEYVGALLKQKNRTDTQRMLVIDNVSGQKNSGSVPGTIGCANPVCETELSIPLCSDDEDEAISEIHAPENIKKCVLDNVDDAGNSYNLVEDLGGVSSDNDYCQIFCKEDYFDVLDDGIKGGIKLNPQIGSGDMSDEENVNCGAYFQLTAHVEGKKDCYTSGGTKDKEINREQYLEDVDKAQSDMVDAINRYIEHYTKYNANDETENIGDCTCCGSNCGTKEKITATWDSYIQYNYSFSNENATLTDRTEPSSSDSWSDGCLPCATTTIDLGDGKTADVCSGCGGVDGAAEDGYQAFLSEHERAYKQAIIDFNDAYERYVTAITNFNACTAGWTNEFPFEQKLSFYYNEYQGNEAYQPYFDLISKSDIGEELYYLEAEEDTLEEEYEIEICTETTTGEYECEGTPYTYEEMNPSVQDYNYAPTYSDVYTERKYVVCSIEGGCVEDIQQISDATFIRKTVKKAQSYITPSVFYQIESNGRVTIRQSDYEGSIVKLDKITLEELTNALPITTLATGGGEFRLMLEDLGEFYTPLTGSEDNYGRLIDFGRVEGTNGENVIPGNNKDSSVAEAVGESGIEKFNGDYVCQYYSDCRPDDCPNCEFVCEDDDCHWEECPECTFDCVGCIINLDELQLNFKPISTVTVESADRELGYNWNVNTTLTALSLLRDKAELTINEIETENETIYTKTGDDSALDFSIRLNGDIIDYLKEYNASVESLGGYANDSLDCYAATINGETYANMFCYSEVIDHLYDEYPDQITVNNRTPEGSRSDNNNSANSNGYWSLWEGWSESEKINGQYSVIGGPAWK